jgi:poly-gamma-glutamate synthesis protein (capsule biosynthesis protein)
MDAETLAHIAARRYTEIERLHSDHLDAPYAMIAYLLWNDRNGYVADLVWHDSSHRLKGDPLAPGTSYLAFFSTDVRADSASEPLTIALAGDIMLGRAVASALERTTVAEAFASAAAALDDAALAFANLESVLTSSASDTGKEIFFKGDPARTDVLRYLGFTHVSVANNHVDDYGYAGWEESVGHLADAGVAPVGDYGNDVEPVTADVAGRRAAFLAYDDTYRPVDTEAMAAAVADAAEKSDAVVVSFHWGVEYEHLPTARQKALAHAAVDAGADVVAGSHPHVLQGIETYGGGLVFYSLGNFVFDQVGKDENESVVAIVTWNDDGTLAYRLTPMRIVGTFPRVATAEESAETLARIVSWSEGL